jgi:hypothetical protein
MTAADVNIKKSFLSRRNPTDGIVLQACSQGCAIGLLRVAGINRNLG